MAQNQLSARGGRPRKVSPQDALDRAVGVFWMRGLDGTSLMDLSVATGLKRPSLAATFGDKRELYVAALSKQAAENAAALEMVLSSDLPLGAVLARLFDGALTINLSGNGGPRGCFLLSTAVAPARDDPQIAAMLRESLASTERLLVDRFARDGIADAAMRGALGASTLHYLAIRARAGEPPAVLRAHGRAVAAWLASHMLPAPIASSEQPT